jgi:hypothetical protein
MTNNFPDEQAVYLAVKNVFKGPEARIRKRKKILEQIRERESAGMNTPLSEHSIETICDVTKILLEKGFFASILQAETQFLESCQLASAQNTNGSSQQVSSN